MGNALPYNAPCAMHLMDIPKKSIWVTGVLSFNKTPNLLVKQETCLLQPKNICLHNSKPIYTSRNLNANNQMLSLIHDVLLMLLSQKS